MQKLAISSFVLAAACAAPGPAARVPPTYVPPPLAEQLRQNRLDFEILSDSIPGFAGVVVPGAEEPCSVTVRLTDPTGQRSRAAAILAPLVAVHPRCGTLRVEQARFTWREMQRAAAGVNARLRAMGLAHPPRVSVRGDTVLAEVHNGAAVLATRDRLARDRSLPTVAVEVRPWSGALLRDGPARPPAGAYLAVLDSVAARFGREPSAGRMMVDTSGVPAELTRAEIESRGLTIADARYRCGIDPRLGFDPPVQLENGPFRLGTVEHARPREQAMSTDYSYEVACADGMCRVVEARPGPGDRIMACPRGR